MVKATPLIPELQLFKNLTLKFQGEGQDKGQN